jgi:hypothetical protein
MISTKFTTGTRLSPLTKKEGNPDLFEQYQNNHTELFNIVDNFELYTCYLDSYEQNQLMISCCEFKTNDFKFRDRINSYLVADERLKECHQVAILGQNTCWMLNKDTMFDLFTKVRQQSGHKRQAST